MTATLQFLSDLCERYGNLPSLIGIEVLNEPHWDVPLNVLLDYYERSYRIVREKCPEQIGIIFSDAFRPGKVSRALSDLGMKNIAIDMHLYQLFTDADRKLDLKGHVHKARKVWPATIRDVSSRLPILIGEWSAAMDEFRGNYTNDDCREYFKTQIETFESQGIGWLYWTARTQDGGVWSLLDHPEFIAN
jgi:glucan 1,3-beta-glucosidase